MILRFFDVGHGDSILVEFPTPGRFAIIDCHRHSESNRLAPDQDARRRDPKLLTHLLQRLDRSETVEIEFVCLTHPHADHYRGLQDVLEELIERDVPIRKFYDFHASVKKSRALANAARKRNAIVDVNDLDELYKVYECVRKIKEKTHDFYRALSCPREIELAAELGVTAKAIAPADETSEEYYNQPVASSKSRSVRDAERNYDDNAISSALIIEFGAFRALLAGDVPNSRWLPILGGLRDRPCSVVKLSHHGSIEGNFPDDCFLISCWRPSEGRIAVVSGGYREQLPSDRAIDSMIESEFAHFITGPRQAPRRSNLGPCPIHTPDHMKPHLAIVLQEAEPKSSNGSKPRGRGDITIRGFRDGRVEVDCEDGTRHPRVPQN